VLLIRGQDALAKCLLVEALSHQPCDVPAANIYFRRFGQDLRRERRELLIIDGDRERQRVRVVADDVHRPRCQIATRHNAVEVDQRGPVLHRPT
jgi:hypothetical protein